MAFSIGFRKQQLIAVGIVYLETFVTPPGFLRGNRSLDELTTKIGKAVAGMVASRRTLADGAGSVRRSGEMGRVGVEPTTLGLRVPCSTS